MVVIALVKRPLPFPNREVKTNCADGTAVWWESRTLPNLWGIVKCSGCLLPRGYHICDKLNSKEMNKSIIRNL